jgi:endonuclease YncB( thermonuclease family)
MGFSTERAAPRAIRRRRPIRPRYRLVEGEFFIRFEGRPESGQPEPDGDTVNFLPDSDDLVQSLPRFSGIAPRMKQLGTYGVRFEGADALETHYQNQHQNLEFATAARDRMLELLGFGKVIFQDARPNKVASAEHNPVRGYLLANGIESNARVLGLVYTGGAPGQEADGDFVFVSDSRLDASVNAVLVGEGLAYAELYSTMPLDLIQRMRQLITAARSARNGMWPSESLTEAKRIAPRSVADLSTLVMFPKLYRRLVAYFHDTHPDLSAFDTWVRADPVHRDDRALLPTGEMGHLHGLFDVDAGGMELRFLPEELTFETDPPVPRPQ